MRADIKTLNVLCGLWLAAVPVLAQQSLESNYRTTGPGVVAVFESQRKVLQTSSAVVMDGRKPVVYGVVVSENGYVLTKASEIREVKSLSVTIDQTVYREVKVAVIDPEWDVALLNVEASGLVAVVYAPTSTVPQGTWVVANGATSRTGRRLLAGIVSAKPREIPAAGGAVLGVVLNAEKKLEVEEVNEKGGAKEAGIAKGDRIVAIDGKKVSKIEEIAEILKEKRDGSVVKVTYRRGKEEKTVEVRLMARAEMFTDQMTRNDQMSGDFSRRRSGFPKVMQHDILGNSDTQGGPLLDLEGRCIGMNIARATRSESFAIPVEELKGLAERMMRKDAE